MAKRAKHVFNSDMCLHVWAHETGDEWGRNGGGSISFRGTQLYSYHAQIASIVKTERHGKVAFFTSRKWSVTTAAHIHHAMRAWSGEEFTVPRLGSSAGISVSDHEENLAYLIERYHNEKARLKRARNFYQSVAVYLEEPKRIAYHYADMFGLTCELPYHEDCEELRLHLEKREKRRNTPSAVRKRMIRDAANAARRAQAEALANERRARLREQAQADLVKWRNGENVYLMWEVQKMEDGSAMLRVKDNKVQTSQGADVPLSHAEAAYGFVRRTREAGLTYDRESAVAIGGAPLRMGHFTLDKIDAQGNIKAGCHYISWNEIERLATEQGWYNPNREVA